jgi:hypothetical protein
MPILGLLFLVGVIFAGHQALQAVNSARPSASGGSAKGKSATKPSGHYSGPSWAGGRSHTGLSWWLSEIGHGFPVTSGGLRQGWRAHQTAMQQWRERGANDTATYAEARRQHVERMEEAAKRAAAAGPVTRPPRVKPPRPTAGTRARRILTARPAPGTDGTDTRLPADKVPGRPASTTPKDKHMGAPGETCTNPACECHTTQPAAAGGSSANGHPPAGSNGGTVTTSTSSGDTTFTSTQELIKRIIQDAENAINPQMVADAEQHADSLPAMIPDDAETVGHISAAAASLREAQDKANQAAESAAAAKASHEKNNAASKEAADAQGGSPERGYVVND